MPQPLLVHHGSIRFKKRGRGFLCPPLALTWCIMGASGLRRGGRSFLCPAFSPCLVHHGSILFKGRGWSFLCPPPSPNLVHHGSIRFKGRGRSFPCPTLEWALARVSTSARPPSPDPRVYDASHPLTARAGPSRWMLTVRADVLPGTQHHQNQRSRPGWRSECQKSWPVGPRLTSWEDTRRPGLQNVREPRECRRSPHPAWELPPSVVGSEGTLHGDTGVPRARP